MKTIVFLLLSAAILLPACTTNTPGPSAQATQSTSPKAPVPELERPAPKDQQLFKKSALITWSRAASGGGGNLSGIYPFTRHNADPSWVISEIGWMTLDPGSSIALHGHAANDDAYVIVSGTGEFTDASGKVTPVSDWDVTIAHPGQKHGLKNTGNTPLYFVDIVSSNKASPDPAWAKETQVFKAADFVTWDRKDLGGGKGILGGKFSYTRNHKKNFPLYEIGWLTLPPGASIGLHEHTDNEDAYIILSGTGEFAGTDGKYFPVGAGDITIARPQQKHAMINTGKVDIVFLCVMAR
jgi:mannose-6-phosphate isomerase-like protein (cupin superfamily)